MSKRLLWVGVMGLVVSLSTYAQEASCGGGRGDPKQSFSDLQCISSE